VLLICPPFQLSNISSLATVQLATFLRGRGIPCSEAYLHFDLARLMGDARYRAATAERNGRIGELLFAERLHGGVADADAQERLAALFGSPSERRAMLDDFDGRCLERVERERPDLVGLTTSCRQLLPALWIARLLKAKHPSLPTVLGGSVCSEPMGPRILEAYPQVDVVVGGFGERPLLALSSGPLGSRRFIGCDDPIDFAQTPIPDYEPFLREARGGGDAALPALAFQSSRGCWWGQKKHCAFCGLNGADLRYSAKPKEMVLRELRTLWERHGCNLYATDLILSRDHLREVIPELGRYETGPRVFYELKTNMRQEEVAALGRARVEAQLGVESLSTRLLGLLGKGVTGIRNVAVLKWCRERRVLASWSLLCAIPGERTEDYDEQIRLISRIPHLQPPTAARNVVITRYSPYFERYREFGWQAIEPRPEFGLLHPHVGAPALRDLAFQFDGVGGVSSAAYFDRLSGVVREWQERFRRGDGLFLDREYGLMRQTAGAVRRVLVPPAFERVLDATHDVAPIDRILETARCEPAVLGRMAAEGLLHVEGGEAVNLAVRVRLDER
jgi:hypothetical protein